MIYKCPVCEGKGVVPNGFYQTYPLGSTTGKFDELCRSCGGTGIIKENEVEITGEDEKKFYKKVFKTK